MNDLEVWRPSSFPGCAINCVLLCDRTLSRSHHTSAYFLSGSKTHVYIDSVPLSRSVMSHSLQPHGLQHARLPCHHQLPELAQLMSIKLVMPSNYLILCCSLLLSPSNFPTIRVFRRSQYFASGSQVLEFQLQHQSFQ